MRWIVKLYVQERQQLLCDMRIRKRARWRICAYLVATYRQSLQENILRERADHRVGLVCACTRNVGRIRPRQGVVYDETQRRPHRIKDEERYRVHRWPRNLPDDRFLLESIEITLRSRIATSGVSGAPGEVLSAQSTLFRYPNRPGSPPSDQLGGNAVVSKRRIHENKYLSPQYGIVFTLSKVLLLK